MDRMRVGLTGLGIVFLSTLAASLLFGPSADDPAIEQHVKAPGEPLAQLGVAPGIEKSIDGQPRPAPDPANPPLADQPPPAQSDPADPANGIPENPGTSQDPATSPIGGTMGLGPANRSAAV